MKSIKVFTVLGLIIFYSSIKQSTSFGSYVAVFYNGEHCLNDSLSNSNIKMTFSDSLGNNIYTYGNVMDSLIIGRTYMITINVRTFYQINFFVYLNKSILLDTVFIEKIPRSCRGH